MGCSYRKPSFPCLGSAKTQLKISPKIFIKLNSSLIIENYCIGAQLGAGSYGVVRLAIHKLTGQKRAIKSIKKQKIPENLQSPSRFFSEIEILMNSDHPNIVRLHEFYEDSKYWHLVTEYLPGGELFDYLMKHKALSESTACKFLKQLLGAVNYCHCLNIVHRDLKPENLLLASMNKEYGQEACNAKGEDRLIKIIDFGTSTIMHGALHKKCGTSYYIAPEVLRQSYNEKCDIWSVGVILFLLLSGKLPFPGKKDFEILQKVEKGIYNMNASEWKYISPEAKDLIKKMLCYNPNLRISAKEALQHPWFRIHEANKNQSRISRSALKRLSRFHASQKLQNAVLTFIASQLSSIEDE